MFRPRTSNFFVMFFYFFFKLDRRDADTYPPVNDSGKPHLYDIKNDLNRTRVFVCRRNNVGIIRYRRVRSRVVL